MGLSDTIACRIGDSPWGPFGDVIELYKTPESLKGLYTYNAKAHPVLSKPDKLFIVVIYLLLIFFMFIVIFFISTINFTSII